MGSRIRKRTGGVNISNQGAKWCRELAVVSVFSRRIKATTHNIATATVSVSVRGMMEIGLEMPISG